MKNRAQRFVRRLVGKQTVDAGKTMLVRYLSTDGLEQTLAMGPGDAAAFGGTRVDVDAPGQITVQPWTQE